MGYEHIMELDYSLVRFLLQIAICSIQKGGGENYETTKNFKINNQP